MLYDGTRVVGSATIATTTRAATAGLTAVRAVRVPAASREELRQQRAPSTCRSPPCGSGPSRVRYVPRRCRAPATARAACAHPARGSRAPAAVQDGHTGRAPAAPAAPTVAHQRRRRTRGWRDGLHARPHGRPAGTGRSSPRPAPVSRQEQLDGVPAPAVRRAARCSCSVYSASCSAPTVVDGRTAARRPRPGAPAARRRRLQGQRAARRDAVERRLPARRVDERRQVLDLAGHRVGPVVAARHRGPGGRR